MVITVAGDKKEVKDAITVGFAAVEQNTKSQNLSPPFAPFTITTLPSAPASSSIVVAVDTLIPVFLFSIFVPTWLPVKR